MCRARRAPELDFEQLGVANLERVACGLVLGKGVPSHRDPDSSSYIVSFQEGIPFAAAAGIGESCSFRGLGLVEETHRVRGLHQDPDCRPFHLVWIAMIRDGCGQIVDCREQEDLECQMLVSCDAIKHKRLVKIKCANGRSCKLTSPSPPSEPKVTPFPCPAKPEGGLPPLAEGCGIGVGDCAGDVTRGLLGIEMGAEDVGCAT